MFLLNWSFNAIKRDKENTFKLLYNCIFAFDELNLLILKMLWITL